METSKRPKFSEYPALQNPALEIRLLTLLPNPDDSAPIEVELRASQLEHVEDEYIALSYAWGDPNNTAPITINGHGHHVTVNLQSALRHLRLPSEMVTLWVDAVCINQDDDAEKSSQVQQMGRIYRSAELVIAWLGEAADDSDFLLELIVALLDEERPKGPEPLRVGEDAELITRLAAIVSEWVFSDNQNWLIPPPPSLPEEETERLVRATSKFLRRDWWSRLWVVQEVLLAREILYQCGRKRLSHEDWGPLAAIALTVLHRTTGVEMSDVFERYEMLSFLISERTVFASWGANSRSAEDSSTSDGEAKDGFYDHAGVSWSDDEGGGKEAQVAGDAEDSNRGSFDSGEDEGPVDSNNTEGDRTNNEESKEAQDLPFLLTTFSRRQTTKPVDRVYGLLGLVDAPQRYGTPDYSKSHVSVFAQVAKVIIENDGHLGFLLVAGIGDSPTVHPHRLPSWAPDWTSRRYALPRGRSRLGACGDTSDQQNYRFLPGLPGTLAAAGVLVDAISNTSAVLDIVDERRLLRPEALILNGKPVPYLIEGKTKLQAYFHALVPNSPAELRPEDFTNVTAAFLYELGNGTGKVSGEAIFETESPDYVLSLLRWAGERRRGRTDEQILRQLTGYEAKRSADENGLDLGAKFQSVYRFARCATNLKLGGHIIETETGFIGMASHRVRRGDVLCVLFGCPAPLVMRQQGDCWTLVQSAFVCGLMEGEAIQQFRDGKLLGREFRIV